MKMIKNIIIAAVCLAIGFGAANTGNIKDYMSLEQARQWQKQIPVVVNEYGEKYVALFEEEGDIDIAKALSKYGFKVDFDREQSALNIISPNEGSTYSFVISLPLEYNKEAGEITCYEYRHNIYRERDGSWRNREHKYDPDTTRGEVAMYKFVINGETICATARVYIAMSTTLQMMIVLDPTRWAQYDVSELIFDPKWPIPSLLEKIRQYDELINGTL